MRPGLQVIQLMDIILSRYPREARGATPQPNPIYPHLVAGISERKKLYLVQTALKSERVPEQDYLVSSRVRSVSPDRLVLQERI
jgi:hypothetical protein